MKRLTNFELQGDMLLGRLSHTTTYGNLVPLLVLFLFVTLVPILFAFNSITLAQFFVNEQGRWDLTLPTQEAPTGNNLIPGQNGGYFVPDYERALFELVNRARLEHELPPYEMNATLVDFAREKGEDLLSNGYIEHNSPRLGRPGLQASRNGVTFSRYGENLAGTLEGKDLAPEVAFYHLMESEHHRNAILCERNQYLGVGVAKGQEKGVVYVMHFMSP